MNIMYKSLIRCLIIGACAADVGANEISCPKTVQVGQPFDVTVTLSNNSCESVAVNRALRGLAGSGKGALKLKGPFVLHLDPPLVIPAGVCNQFGHVTEPGEITTIVRIVGNTPADLAGKAALAYVQVLKETGKGGLGRTCMAEIVP